MTSIELQLEKFREAYPSTRCNVEDNYIMYIFSLFTNAKKQCQKANKLIEENGWDLVAIHAGSNHFFTVQSNLTENA